MEDGLPRRNVKPKPSQKVRRKKKTLKPGIFIEGGVHGREWISPAVATWILRELVKFNNTEGKPMILQFIETKYFNLKFRWKYRERADSIS